MDELYLDKLRNISSNLSNIFKNNNRYLSEKDLYNIENINKNNLEQIQEIFDKYILKQDREKTVKFFKIFISNFPWLLYLINPYSYNNNFGIRKQKITVEDLQDILEIISQIQQQYNFSNYDLDFIKEYFLKLFHKISR